MDEKHIHNTNLLFSAIANGDVGLLECTDAVTGQPAPCICIFSGTGKDNEVAVIPVARLFIGAPLDQVKLPSDLAAVVKEFIEMKALAIASSDIEAPAAGGLH